MRILAAKYLAMAIIAAGAPCFAQDGRITVELNKLETAPDTRACKAFFLFRNDTGKAFEGFELSLAILGPNGVIDQLLTIDAAPLPLGRTTLKLFEIPQTDCADISEILVHEIPSCKPQNEDPTDCFAIVDLVSRTATGLVD